jgi:undecaprenyl-diphosphatase
MSYNFFLELFLEWLPISSSGHIALLSSFFPSLVWPLSSVENYFCHAAMIPFEVLVGIYFLFCQLRGSFSPLRCFLSVILHCGAITLVTSVMYIFFHLFNIFHYFSSLPLFIGFLATSVMLMKIQKSHFFQKKVYEFSFFDSVVLGLAQSMAFLPGVSRFVSILFFSFFLGYSRQAGVALVVFTNGCLSLGSLVLCLSSKTPLALSPYSSFLAIFCMAMGVAAFFLFYDCFLKKNLYFFIFYEFFVSFLSLLMGI